MFNLNFLITLTKKQKFLESRLSNLDIFINFFLRLCRHWGKDQRVTKMTIVSQIIRYGGWGQKWTFRQGCFCGWNSLCQLVKESHVHVCKFTCSSNCIENFTLGDHLKSFTSYVIYICIKSHEPSSHKIKNFLSFFIQFDFLKIRFNFF